MLLINLRFESKRMPPAIWLNIEIEIGMCMSRYQRWIFVRKTFLKTFHSILDLILENGER